MNNEVISGDEGNAEVRAAPTAIDTEHPIAKPNRFNAVMLVMLAAAVLATVAYVYYRTGRLDAYGDRLSTLEQHINVLDGKLQTLESRYSELSGSVKDVESKQELLHDSINSMFQKQKGDTEDWALAEIEHLLIIATLDADINTALAAMQAADDRLNDMSDPSLLNTRKQVLSDINTLKSVTAVDIPGMAMYMVDIINRVEQLPLKKSERTAPQQQNSNDAQTAGPETVPLWKRLLRTVWHELKGLVVISREKDAGVLSLVPEQRYYLYQNLRMELDAARLAILRRDTENLRASLGLVQGWLEKYFDVNDTAVANIMDSLEQMSRVTLRPNIPDISSSLETLRAYIRERAAPEPVESQAPTE